MTSFRKYFIYHFKATLPRLAVIAAITLIWTVANNGLSVYEIEDELHCSVMLPGDVMIVVSALIAALEFLPFKNRRNLDALLSLPVDRTKMSLSHLLCGFIQVAAVTVVITLTELFMILPYSHVLRISYYPAYFLFLLFGSFICYFFHAFLFNKANTAVDGVIFQVLFYFIPNLLGLAVADIINLKWDSYLRKFFDIPPFPIGLISKVASSFGQLINGGKVSAADESIAVYAVYVALGIAATVGTVYELSRVRAEKIGGISDSWLGYKTYIPVLGFSTIITINGDITALILMLIGYCIYRRGIKLKRSDIIILSIAAAMTLMYYVT